MAHSEKKKEDSEKPWLFLKKKKKKRDIKHFSNIFFIFKFIFLFKLRLILYFHTTYELTVI